MQNRRGRRGGGREGRRGCWARRRLRLDRRCRERWNERLRSSQASMERSKATMRWQMTAMLHKQLMPACEAAAAAAGRYDRGHGTASWHHALQHHTHCDCELTLCPPPRTDRRCTVMVASRVRDGVGQTDCRALSRFDQFQRSQQQTGTQAASGSRAIQPKLAERWRPLSRCQLTAYSIDICNVRYAQNSNYSDSNTDNAAMHAVRTHGRMRLRTSHPCRPCHPCPAHLLAQPPP